MEGLNLKATSSRGLCLPVRLYSHPQGTPDFPILRPIGKRGISLFPIPAESGIGDSLPDSRPNGESGERELGISGSASGTHAAGSRQHARNRSPSRRVPSFALVRLASRDQCVTRLLPRSPSIIIVPSLGVDPPIR
jgi:hypothetical protein